MIQARQLWKWLSVKLAVIGFSLVVTCLLVCWFFGISSPLDIYAYHEMHASFPPVWKEFALRRFGQGDEVGRLLRAHPPTITRHYGEWTLHNYHQGDPRALVFSGLWVVCKSNVLVSVRAGNCLWDHIFFEDTKQMAEFQSACMIYGNPAGRYIEKHSKTLSAVARFDAVFLQKAPFDEVRIVAWLESEDCLRQLKAFIGSNPPPYDVSWWTKVEPGFRTDEDFQKKSALLRKNPNNFVIP